MKMLLAALLWVAASLFVAARSSTPVTGRQANLPPLPSRPAVSVQGALGREGRARPAERIAVTSVQMGADRVVQ